MDTFSGEGGWLIYKNVFSNEFNHFSLGISKSISKSSILTSLKSKVEASNI